MFNPSSFTNPTPLAHADTSRDVLPRRARISRQSNRRCWRSPQPRATALVQRDFGCVLGVQQTKQLPHVAKVDLVWQLGVKSGSIVDQLWTPCFLSLKDPESAPARETIQSGDCRRSFGQCVPRVVTHYPVEIWLWSNPEAKEEQLDPTPRICSAGCLKYRQYVLEKCESDIQNRPIP
ncbi:hypothetical protein TNCV_5065021 [Trichonephila clavipes]|nr:hypothetical protein TNCV_5065021 [Trichonephila clavipes]